MFKMILKRNQALVPFEREKIEAAIFKALVVAVEERPRQSLKVLATAVTDRVIYSLSQTLKDHEHPTVECIQDQVELTLMVMGEHKTAKAYIKYRYKHLEQRALKENAGDLMVLFGDYLGKTDSGERGGHSYCLQGLNKHIVGKTTKHFWLHHIYSETVRSAHEKGDLHIHDLDLLSTYCCGWAIEDLLIKGFGGGPGQINASPPKHFETVLMQVVNYIYTLQGEAAGGQSISNFDTLLAPFIHMDALTYKDVKQMIQAFVFNMNIGVRGGCQPPKFHMTLDKEVPISHRDLPIIVGGHYHYDLKYGDFQKEMDMINMAFCEVMIKGDSNGLAFTCPVPTYNISDHWHWDNPVGDKIMEMTAKRGKSYFCNGVNSDCKNGARKNDPNSRTLMKRGGALYGAYPHTGSIGVVTINMARLGYTSDSVENLMQRLERLMDISYESLEAKREVLESNMEKGLYPYSKFYLQEAFACYQAYWFNHFSTIGLSGMNECIINFTQGRENIMTDVGKALAEVILDSMNEVLKTYQDKSCHLYNLEASPLVTTAYRFAKLDLEKYPDIMVADKAGPCYTNNTELPFDHQEDLFDALDHQESLQVKYTGGTVFRGDIGRSGPVIKDNLRALVKQYRMPYFSAAVSE